MIANPHNVFGAQRLLDRQMRLRSRHVFRVLGGSLPERLHAASAAYIQYGRPQTSHGSGETETYDLVEINAAGTDWVDRSVTLAGVFQKTGYSFDADVVHVIWPAQGLGDYKHVAWPIELLDCEGGELNIGSKSELTIASGVVTKTGSYHRIDTESDASTDDLDTINGGTEGDILVLSPQTGARDVVVKDNTGNMQCNGDFTMTSVQDTIVFIFSGNNWLELSRSDNTT
jgi:hypothetical protein